MRIIMGIAVLLLLTSLLVVGCGDKEEPAYQIQEQAEPAEVEKPVVDQPDTMPAPDTIAADTIETVAPEGEGGE
ncbi:MAG: hypothetical protein KAT58_08305 [candidate division Zixibacteria bacterium]|nr:hypothetical protein [candidate division Zixibacteria bacterium]